MKPLLCYLTHSIDRDNLKMGDVIHPTVTYHIWRECQRCGEHICEGGLQHELWVASQPLYTYKKLEEKEGVTVTMIDLVERWKQIHRELADVGLTEAQREDATSAILTAENPAVTITVNDGGGGSGGGEKMYTVEGRVGEMGAVKFSLDAIRWELGPGGAQYPNWDSDSAERVIAKFEELTGYQVHEVQG